MQLTTISQQLEAIKETEGVIGIGFTGDKDVSVQIYHKDFKDFADGHTVTEDRTTHEVYIRLQFTVGNVTFFTLVTDDEYEQDFLEWLHPELENDVLITTPDPMKLAGHKLQDFQ